MADADNRITQPSYTAGELSDELHGRKDLARYQVGARIMRNTYPLATGGAQNRAGLRFAAEVKDSAREYRLMPFEAAGDDSFVLVWGHENVRPMAFGGYIDNGGVPYEVSTPYTDVQLPDLYMEQSNDIATLTHPLWKVRELARFDALDWRLSTVTFASTVSPPYGVDATTTEGYTGYDGSHLQVDYDYKVASVSVDGKESLPSNVARTDAPLVMGYSQNFVTVSWQTDGLSLYRHPAPTGVLRNGTRIDRSLALPNGKVITALEFFSGDARSVTLYIVERTAPGTYTRVRNLTVNHPGGGWARFALTPSFTVPNANHYVGAYSAGGVASRINLPMAYQGAALGSGSTAGLNEALVEGAYAMGWWQHEAGASADEEIEEYLVYRGSNGIFGLIGRTPELSFKDDNIAPNFSLGPQQDYNPFVNAGDFPSIAFFAQQRRGFAASLNRPQTIWMSQSADFGSMSSHVPTAESDAIEFTLAAQKKQDIFHVLSLEQGLIVFTRSGEWKVTGRDGDIITPSSQLPSPQSTYGSTRAVKPMVVGEAILFISGDQKTVLEMQYSFEVDRYKADDMTLLSQHLFKGRKIVNWGYARSPYGMIWCVMDDGSLLSMTYLKDHDVWGWSRHDTPGKFLDVAVIREDNRDVPYFIVQRRIEGVARKYIEYLADRKDTDARDAFFVDCGLSYDPAEPMIAFASIGARTRLQVQANGYTVGDEIEVTGTVLRNANDDIIGTLDGRYHVDEVSTVNAFYITYARDGEDHQAGDQVDTSIWAGAVLEPGICRVCVNQVSGLDHLEGRTVIALCDGFVVDSANGGSSLVVEGGALPEFDSFYARIHVGLATQAVLGTLDLLNTQADDNGVIKTAAGVKARLLNSRGVKIGVGSQDEAVELRSRDDEDYYSPPDMLTGIFDIGEIGGWDDDVPVYFVQDYPLPMTVLGTTIEYVYGGS